MNISKPIWNQIQHRVTLFSWNEIVLLISALAVASCSISSVSSQNAEPRIRTFKKNGAWCWFQDERAIIDGNKLIFATVTHKLGSGGNDRHGNMEVTTCNLEEKSSETVVLHEKLGADDHNVPALLELDNGRYLAVYSKHSKDNLIRSRVSKQPGDSLNWSDEQTFEAQGGVTYSNLFQLSAEDHRIYNFYRGKGSDPNYIYYDYQDNSWTRGGRLLAAPGRPYLKYTSNMEDTIHFVTTEQHPNKFDNSIYHGVFRDQTVYTSNGEKVAELKDQKTSPIKPPQLTRVYKGDENHVAWTVDLHLDQNGLPYTVFSVQFNKNPKDHRYFYGRWNGTEWEVHEMAYAGSNLYGSQKDYTGLAALDPDNPNVVYISTDVHPETNEPLISSADDERHYEIFRGETEDRGETWQWTPVTKNSEQDQLRPIIPKWNRNYTAVLWLRGTYTGYKKFDLNVVGFIKRN